MAKVLVVDDSPTEVLQFKDMLESLGYEVITAENGRDGVAMTSKEQPDLVLMDIVMPGVNGYQATRLLSRGSTTSHIPVVLISGKDQESDKIWGKRQGAKGYIVKPVKENELASVIDKLI